MDATTMLREWLTSGNQFNRSLFSFRNFYYTKLIEKPVNVVVLEDFENMLTTDYARQFYNHVITDNTDGYQLLPPLIRFNCVLPLFHEDIRDFIKNLADIFSLLVDKGFLNYGCLTQMQALSIQPKNKQEQLRLFCYCYTYSEYSLEVLNTICSMEMFCTDCSGFSTLPMAMSDISLVRANIEDWFSVHKLTNKTLL